MPEVCDYSIIINQRQDLREIKAGDIRKKKFNFNTGGRERREALLFITIQGPDRNVGIKINGSRVGIIQENRNSTAPYTQIIRLPGTILKNGENTLIFEDPGFIVENITCFFKQKA